jgi:hypothetical protein
VKAETPTPTGAALNQQPHFSVLLLVIPAILKRESTLRLLDAGLRIAGMTDWYGTFCQRL